MRIIISSILWLFSISAFAQARLALTTNSDYSDAYFYKNCAVISNILLNQYGDEWYEENLLSKISLTNSPFCLKIDMCGYLTIEHASKLSSEFKKAILNVIDIIEQEHVIMYGLWAHYNALILNSKSITSLDISNIISRELKSSSERTFFYMLWSPWFFLLPGNEQYNYKYYVEEEIASAREPLTYLEWLKAKINYYISCPIESSLDYGITNEVFCPDYN